MTLICYTLWWMMSRPRVRVQVRSGSGRSLSWFVPQPSMSLRSLASASDGSTHLQHSRIDLQPNWVVSLLLILSYGLSYVSIILLYLILSILLVYISTPDLCP